MSVCVFCSVLSPPVPVTGLLSSISVFKLDKVPVRITGLSSPGSPTCHSPSVMKASSFCLKVGDERGTAVRDLVGLTDRIRVADPGQRGTREEREGWGCSCLTGLREGVQEEAYIEQSSVLVFITDGRWSKVGVEIHVPVHIRKTSTLQFHFSWSWRTRVSQTEVMMIQQWKTSHAKAQPSRDETKRNTDRQAQG